MWALRDPASSDKSISGKKLFVNLNGEDILQRYDDCGNSLLSSVSKIINDLLDRQLFTGVVLQPHGPDDLQVLAKLGLISSYHRHRILEFGQLSTYDN